MSSLSLCATDAYVIRADGSGRTRLTDSPRFHEGEPPDLANNPVFAPNGTQIMYSHFLPMQRRGAPNRAYRGHVTARWERAVRFPSQNELRRSRRSKQAVSA